MYALDTRRLYMTLPTQSALSRLLAKNPLDVVDQRQPDDMVALMREHSGTLTNEQAQRLDLVAFMWTSPALESGIREAVLTLQDLCQLGLQFIDPQDVALRTRMQVYFDLLEARRRVLNHREVSQA